MPASLQDVARMVGVSISTVSRALHRPEMVDAQTRERVNIAVTALGYVPQGIGRALVSGRTYTVGAVVPRMGVSAFAQTIQALRHGLGQANYTLLLAQPPLKEQHDLRPLKTLIERGVDGVVLLGNDWAPEWRNLIAKHNLPVATIWADAKEAPAGAIGFDNYESGKQAAEHLLGLGHRKFALISGDLASNLRARQRYQALLETIASGGGVLSRKLIVETDYGFPEGFEATRKLLETGESFTALICGNDYLAHGAMACLREHGQRIPEDVSVIGFNDSEFAPYTYPPLTTIHFPSLEIGARAAQTILDSIESKGPMPAPQMLPTYLVERSSTGPAIV
ncbi:LacI family DNA-binding transcriptional regulator [Bordetella sp. 02P26C-1]|uniref:LacI family DNA-binding transcriptional regulator n=1 Tax=Bordetella sp. 02P26C-1 TaxID=2683195 RepID=UPI001354504C|nr:LacI family DNA-binding transcriptional regulator [Bordetella sp. 02P26C-1]MVW78484.1 LacI family DNA-binding transcriptional regulator [Bordetella sp. 02P26C-1]